LCQRVWSVPCPATHKPSSSAGRKRERRSVGTWKGDSQAAGLERCFDRVTGGRWVLQCAHADGYLPLFVLKGDLNSALPSVWREIDGEVR
jgi:hypothetical protein